MDCALVEHGSEKYTVRQTDRQRDRQTDGIHAYRQTEGQAKNNKPAKQED